MYIFLHTEAHNMKENFMLWHYEKTKTHWRMRSNQIFSRRIIYSSTNNTFYCWSMYNTSPALTRWSQKVSLHHLFRPVVHQIWELSRLQFLDVICSHLAGFQGKWFQVLELLQMLQPCTCYAGIWNIQRHQLRQPCIPVQTKVNSQEIQKFKQI